MRAYLIEDIYDDNAATIVTALDEKGWRGGIEGIYYLPLPENLLDPEQVGHLEECGPFMMALEVVDRPGDTHDLKLELLVRAKGRMRCSCVKYADARQRAYMMELLDTFISELDISV